MKENSRSFLKIRYAVILVDTDLATGEVHQSDLRYYDDQCDAELWIKTNGYSYSVVSDSNICRFLRIEKRYYPV